MKLENTMNKKIKFKNLQQYIITAIFALGIVVVFCFYFELDLLFKTEKQVNFKELNTQNLYEFFTIEELEKKLKENPTDYTIHIRLAKLYEELNQPSKANDFYKTALTISNRSNYTLYSYAMFCARHNLYVFAATLAEQLDGQDEKLNFYKAKIYESIAQNLDNKKDYPAATKSYEIVYKYAKTLKDKKYLKEIKEKYALEYIKLADYHIKNKEIELAISDLNNSLNLKKTPLAQYKLGLIYIEFDEKRAEKYIHDAFKEMPTIVNPYIYNSLLEKLIYEAKNNQKSAMANFYSTRQAKFQNKISKIYLYKSDVEVINTKFYIKNKTLLNKRKFMLDFKIKNKSKNDLSDLDLKIEIYLNQKRYIIEKNLFPIASPLASRTTSDTIQVDLTQKVEFNNLDQNNDLVVRFFGRKDKQAPYVLLKIELVNI